MWQCINEERGKMSFMRMKPSLHNYLDNLCLACNLENNNRWNYALRGRCFIEVLNVFRWCVTLGNRVHDISTETGLTITIEQRPYHCPKRQELMHTVLNYELDFQGSTWSWKWNNRNKQSKNVTKSTITERKWRTNLS
jgi:hypothetical protein